MQNVAKATGNLLFQSFCSVKLRTPTSSSPFSPHSSSSSLHPSLPPFISLSQGGLDLLVTGQRNFFPASETIGSFLSHTSRCVHFLLHPTLPPSHSLFPWDRAEVVYIALSPHSLSILLFYIFVLHSTSPYSLNL